jgi:hypothetical protein
VVFGPHGDQTPFEVFAPLVKELLRLAREAQERPRAFFELRAAADRVEPVQPFEDLEGAGRRSSSVDLAPVPDLEHEDDEAIVLHAVNDAIIANADPEAFTVALQRLRAGRGSWRSWSRAAPTRRWASRGSEASSFSAERRNSTW